MSSPETYDYSIDGADTLIYVSESWLSFARDNEGNELTRENVVGRSIWEFIYGAETQQVYKTLFQWVREHGATIKVPFRCDAPNRLRWMELQLSGFSQGGIHLKGVMLREQRLWRSRWLPRAIPLPSLRQLGWE